MRHIKGDYLGGVEKMSMFKRKVACVLLITLLVPMFVACGKQDAVEMPKQTSDIIFEGILNSENMNVDMDGVGLSATAITLEEDTKLTISKVSGAQSLDEAGEILLDVYDFNFEGVEAFEGVVELTIPLSLSSNEMPGAAYLNESTGAWEPIPFIYDAAQGAVVIYTDHLSKYGVFSISGEGTRRARIEFLGLFGESSDENYLAAVEEYAIDGVPAGQCVDIGTSAAADALQLGADFLGNIAQSAGYLAYGDDVLATMGDSFGRLGLLVSVVQVGTNIYNGKTHEAVVGSMKASFTYVMGKVVSKLSNSVLSASMAAVAITDYAINKFGTEALTGRASMYRDAYAIYYQKSNDGYMSSADWFRQFYPYFSNPTMNEAEIRAEIDRIVTAHCNEFWTGSNRLGIDYYVSEARENFKWTASEAGLNDSVRNEISAERRSILFNDVLPGVFNQIALKVNLENERKLREEYQALSTYLNQVIQFSVKDEKKLYADHLVRFGPLNDQALVENWTGKFKSDGSLSTAFTLYAHMLAGAPNELRIYEPKADIERDEPIRVIEFKVTPPAVEIILGDDLSGLMYVSGDTSKVPQFGLDVAFKAIEAIKIEKDGSFKVELDYATGSGGSGNNRFTSEVRGFVLSGKIDPGTLSGNATFSTSMSFNRKEISPLEAMEGETKEFVTSYVYDDNVSGTVSISGSDGNVTFAIQMEGTRSGYSKLQHHSIDQSGEEKWGDNPTITDKSGEFTSSGTYKFEVKGK